MLIQGNSAHIRCAIVLLLGTCAVGCKQTPAAFILGVVPLVLAKGAGAEMRFTLGVAVFSGMLGVTVFGIFFTPVFYSVIMWFTEKRTPSTPATDTRKQAMPEKQ